MCVPYCFCAVEFHLQFVTLKLTVSFTQNCYFYRHIHQTVDGCVVTACERIHTKNSIWPFIKVVFTAPFQHHRTITYWQFCIQCVLLLVDGPVRGMNSTTSLETQYTCMFKIWYFLEFSTKASVFIENSWIYPLVMQLNAQPNYQTTTFKIIEYIFRYAAQLVKTEPKEGNVREQDTFVQVLIAAVNFIYMKWCDGSTSMSIVSYWQATNTIDIATTKSLCTLPFIWNKTLWSCTESLFAV